MEVGKGGLEEHVRGGRGPAWRGGACQRGNVQFSAKNGPLLEFLKQGASRKVKLR